MTGASPEAERASRVVETEHHATESTPDERPPSVRQPKAELRARVNGQLQLRYARRGVTSYAGLEFVRRFLHGAGWVRTLRQELAGALPPTDFGVVGMVLASLA